MNAYLIERLKDGRIKKGLKQSDVTNLTGIKNTTLSNYENGNTEPDMDTFLQLCELYELDYAEILETAYSYKSKSIDFLLGEKEKSIIKKYRDLDSHGKLNVDTILKNEHDRIQDYGKLEKVVRPTYIMTYYHSLASAGTGEYIFEDLPTATIEVPANDLSENADFVIGVNGDSMEPTYFNGDKVYVEKVQMIEIGEIGIFMVNNECFIKEAGKDGLVSHNKKYDTIPGSESIQCIGKVLGKVNQ